MKWTVRYKWEEPGHKGNGAVFVSSDEPSVAIRRAAKNWRGLPITEVTVAPSVDSDRKFIEVTRESQGVVFRMEPASSIRGKRPERLRIDELDEVKT